MRSFVPDEGSILVDDRPIPSIIERQKISSKWRPDGVFERFTYSFQDQNTLGCS